MIVTVIASFVDCFILVCLVLIVSLIVNCNAIYNQYFYKPNKNKIFFYFFYKVLMKVNTTLNYRRKIILKINKKASDVETTEAKTLLIKALR